MTYRASVKSHEKFSVTQLLSDTIVVPFVLHYFILADTTVTKLSKGHFDMRSNWKALILFIFEWVKTPNNIFPANSSQLDQKFGMKTKTCPGNPF